MSTRLIKVRPSRDVRWQKQGGWEVFESDGVSPVYCGTDGRQSTLGYARQQAGYGRCEIRVLDEEWNLTETIGNEDFAAPGLGLGYLLLFNLIAAGKTERGRDPFPYRSRTRQSITEND